MKIVKKIGIGFLAFVICFCSCFKFVNAYDFSNFEQSYTQPGTQLYRPLLTASLNRVSTATSTVYYSYPLTQSFYRSSGSSSNIHNEIYNDQLQARYSLGSTNIGTHKIYRFNINFNDPNAINVLDELQFAYRYTNVVYYSTSTAPIERFELCVDYNMFRTSDLIWTLSLYANDTISGSVDVKYIIEGYDLNNSYTNIEYDFNIPINIVGNVKYFAIHHNPYDNVTDFGLNMGDITPTRYSVQIKPHSDFVGDFSSINKYEFATMNVDVTNHSLITQFLLTHYNLTNTSTTPTPPLDNNTDFTSWLVNSVGAFMNFEIFPGFQLSTMLGVIVAIPLLIYILKFFMGG